MKASCILLLISFLILSGTCLMMSELPIVTEQHNIVEPRVAPLEIARRATFAMYLPGCGIKGTGVLVGRKKLDNGYRYTALTAYHVVVGMSKKFINNKTTASHQLNMMFQPRFHGKPFKLNLKIEDIQWTSPSEDWSAIIFVTQHKLDCAQVATRKEFYTIKSFEKIYAVGCGGQYHGQHCRDGVMGATHNEHEDTRYQKNVYKAPPWDRHPTKFFRPSINVWYGDSGGGIFSKEGKLIGIINGYGIMSHWGGPVTHSTIAIKAHIIRDLVSINKDFFLIED